MSLFSPENQEAKAMKQHLEEQKEFEMRSGLMSGANQQADLYEQAAQDERADKLAALTKWQQSLEVTFRRLFLNLAGVEVIEKDSKTRLIPSKWNHGVCSVYGAKKLVDFLEVIDKNVMLGSWKENEINLTIRMGLAYPLIKTIRLNYKKYAIDLRDADYVLNLCLNAVQPTFYRGLNNGERAKDREMVKIHEIRNDSQKQPKKGLFGLEA